MEQNLQPPDPIDPHYCTECGFEMEFDGVNWECENCLNIEDNEPDND